MKKVMLVLLVGIFMVGVVSAVTCDDSQTIMRLYQDSNSHVSMWDVNVVDYVEEICYDKIFGVPYTGADPHTCTAGDANKVLSLYNTGNSHASNVSDANYPFDVCYGNLVCAYEVRNDGTCTNGGEIVVRMYSGTNTHVANASGTVYDSQICCVGSELYWANANGVKITQADEVNIGDTIQAVVTGAGDTGTFNIKEDDTWTPDDNITVISDSDADGKLVGEWKITQTDLDKTYNFDRFYFKTDVTGTDKSDEIAINGTYDDSPMEVTVVSPSCGDNFSMGSKVEIEISASDEDDFIIGTVEINDVIVVPEFSNGGVVFNYTFDSDGNFQIVADAVNSRGKRARHIANVMITSAVDGNSYVAACIDEPKDFSDLEDSNVDFDASTTKAIVVSGGVNEIFTPVSNPLNFSWYWTFMPENRVHEYTNSPDEEAYLFSANFPIAGGNSASLRVEFD